jgi:glycosyltransferase involved in cell wall biosynthesis
MNFTADENPYSVSVVIPAYNVESYLARAIDSVLDQTQPPDEIIVVDDGSTDQTASIAQSYGSKIRYFHQENAGLSAARNTGIRNAACTWIALLDGDDEWLPVKLQLEIDLLKRNPQLVWACTNCYFHWVHLNKRVRMHETDSLKSQMADKEFLDDYLLAANQGAVGHPNTMIFKRQAVMEAGLFREGLAFYEDHDMWWRLAYRWPKFGYLPQPLAVYYHNRPGSLTHAIARPMLVQVLCELIDRHLKLAASYGRLQELKIRLEVFLTWILQNLLQEQQQPQVLRLINRYGFLLRTRIRTEMRLRATFPSASFLVINTYHWLKRKTRFRRT